MPLASTAEVLRQALTAGYAVGGFEPYTFDQIQGIIEAAEEEQAPVIIQLWSEVIETWGFPALTAVVKELAGRASIPVCLHLDHAKDDTLIDAALEAGFTSVMYDGSTLPFDENVERTRAVVARAKPFGASVEAELGIIGFLADYPTPEEAMAAIGVGAKRLDETDSSDPQTDRPIASPLLTSPEQAERFVRETGIDILAPAVGSIHGCPLPMARLDISRIRAISAATGIPLALHGGSGVGEEMVRQAIGAGIAKVNIDAEVRALYITSLKEEVTAIGSGERVFEDLARYPRRPREIVREAVRARMRVLMGK